MVCRDVAKKYLALVNGIVILMGLLIVAAGGFLIAKIGEPLSFRFGETSVFAPLLVGAVVTLVGIIGCRGARKQSRCLLLLYWIVMTFVTLIVLGGGVAFMAHIGALDDVKLGESAALVDSTQQKISDTIIAVFDTCCGAGDNTTKVPTCDADSSANPCIFDQDFVESLDVPEEVCTFLSENAFISRNGTEFSLISSVGCQDALSFKEDLSSFVEGNAQTIGITLIVLSVLLLLVDMFTCCLICSNREDFDDEYRQKLQQQRNGAAIAGTAGQGVQYA